MELGDRALPLTRGQLDIWLAQEAAGRSGMEWQLGLFVKVEGTVERDALEWAIRRVVRGAEPARAVLHIGWGHSGGSGLERHVEAPICTG